MKVMVTIVHEFKDPVEAANFCYNGEFDEVELQVTHEEYQIFAAELNELAK